MARYDDSQPYTPNYDVLARRAANGPCDGLGIVVAARAGGGYYPCAGCSACAENWRENWCEHCGADLSGIDSPNEHLCPALAGMTGPGAPDASGIDWGGRSYGELSPHEQETVNSWAASQIGAELTANADTIADILTTDDTTN